MQTQKWKLTNSYAGLPELFYTKQSPLPVRNPQQVIFNQPLAELLGVPLDLSVFAGNAIPDNTEPLAQAYAGHQFGHFTMLGDGRAILIGEQVTRSGERFDIQLKGAGRTVYSRNGDGRAALAPMLREYIISEAMHSLGNPTTRSLAVVSTGETVMRKRRLPGAILTRVAASHIRVGTFEYASHFGMLEDVRKLADYTIMRHFGDIALSENKYLLLLEEVVKKQADLISKWQSVGFIHGVMNTDNMAISGETIDYGPCAFMDAYDPSTVFSSIDTHGRYSYENQPKIAVWNLARFIETLLPLLHKEKKEAVNIGNAALESFQCVYEDCWNKEMRAKIGIFDSTDSKGDEVLANELLQLMHQHKADYTNTFRALSLANVGDADAELFTVPKFQNWKTRWQARLQQQGKSISEISELMKSSNPTVIPRNHRVEEALTAAENGDISVVNKLLSVLSKPYDYTADIDDYSQPPPCTSCGYKTFCGT